MALAAPVGLGDDPKPKKKEPTLMQRKLEHAQKVLAAVTMNDFETIIASGNELIDISKDAQWKWSDKPAYELLSSNFRRDAQALVKSARDRNIDAATLAYVEMTLSCVKCHKHIREVRMTRLD